MSGAPTFILGLGAQKAGSTWVQSYLNADPRADFGPLKEYHTWDVLHLPELEFFDHRARSPLRGVLEGQLRRLLRKGPDTDGIRGRLQRDPEGYFAFFARLLRTPGVSLTGDITPAYAGVPAEVLAHVRDRFAQMGVRVRVVFMMRDPVARCVSAAQMHRRKGQSHEGVALGGTLDEAVLAYAQSEQARIRADYPSTLARIGAVFDPSDVFVGLYETIFSEAEVSRLSAFAGVSARPELAASRVNTFEKTEQVSAETRAALHLAFQDIYAECAVAFPETQTHWAAHETQ